ncbi:MAG TPA: DUF6580 family putative transport protein [Candidatus Saccharimonadales bacterium]|nr:DUF6580 family putative transport protein [Candidatus Saccharimonadales bacterium]
MAPIAVILLAAIFRLLPHAANFAPITAMALFGGVYLNKRWAIIAPLLAMFISNYLLLYVNPFGTPYFNFTHLYSPLGIFNVSLIAVYISFVISGFVGIWLKNHKNAPTILGSALFCSVQFFLITNASVWIEGMYSRSIIGLWQSYVAGIPFFRGTFLGDIVYTTAFFGSFELIQLFANKKAEVKVSS